ncbi:hypothetical protein BKA70DRAFT_1410857 [Coprinopsis sp. MPI-PUGE-AT-0042]|nr:hypothetical protein BKA70DRAFT_1410857 [Coprinopsis sp. MPI-PUGE-AT-0042]
MSEAQALRLLESIDERGIGEYKTWIGLPDIVRKHPFFSAGNWKLWVNVATYSSYLRARVGNSGSEGTAETLRPYEASVSGGSGSQKRPPQSPTKVKTEPKRMRLSGPADSEDEVIDLTLLSSDDESRSTPSKLPSTMGAGPMTPSPTKRVDLRTWTPVRNSNSKIPITRKVKVDDVQVLDKIPDIWPSTASKTAYALDLDGSRDGTNVGKLTQTGQLKTLNKDIKLEDQDSWGGGTSGSANPNNAVKLQCFDSAVPARRAAYSCNGSLVCEDSGEAPGSSGRVLDGYKRVDAADAAAMQQLYLNKKERNAAEGGSSLGLTTAFYHMMVLTPCKLKNCNGKPVVRQKRIQVPKDGHRDSVDVQGISFIGCANWSAANTDHRYVPIVDAGIDVVVLEALLNGQSIDHPDLHLFQDVKCSTVLHPRHGGQKLCKHIHYDSSGHPIRPKMIKRPCEAKKFVYSTQDVNNPGLVVVILEGFHNHPVFPKEKLGLEAKADLEECYQIMTQHGHMTTPQALDRAPSTLGILGQSLSEKYPAFRNKRTLGDAVKKLKLTSAPDGLGWKGLIALYDEEQALDPEDRYLWELSMQGNTKILVTLFPALARLIHRSRYLVADYTFKRVKKLAEVDLNEYEVVVWDDHEQRRITVARVYCNGAATEDFRQVFEMLDRSVKSATGKNITFRVFQPDNGNLLGIILDMEAAQGKGLGIRNDPDELVHYVLKECYVHFKRQTEELSGVVSPKELAYIQSLDLLETAESIEEWKQFCKTHPQKKIRDWYAHKISQTWILPGFNRLLSKIPDSFWKQLPNHTNLVETAHAGTNKVTNIGLTPVEAVKSARQLDMHVVNDMLQAKNVMVSPNRHNQISDRVKRNTQRQTLCAQRSIQSSSTASEISNVSQMIAENVQATKDMRSRLKDLRGGKKKSLTNRRSRAAKTSSLKTIPEQADEQHHASSSAMSTALAVPEYTFDAYFDRATSNLASTRTADSQASATQDFFGNDFFMDPIQGFDTLCSGAGQHIPEHSTLTAPLPFTIHDAFSPMMPLDEAFFSDIAHPLSDFTGSETVEMSHHSQIHQSFSIQPAFTSTSDSSFATGIPQQTSSFYGREGPTRGISKSFISSDSSLAHALGFSG